MMKLGDVDPWLLLLAFWLVFVPVILIIVYEVLPARRARALQQVAAETGFSFQASGDALWNEAFAAFPLFARQRKRVIRNVVRGVRDVRDFVMFD